MSKQEEPWSLVIGRVTAPFGIRGEVRVRPETDFPERFRELEEVCLELANGEERVVRLLGARITAKGVLVKVEGVMDRDGAEGLRRALLKVRPSTAPALPEGSYWWRINRKRLKVYREDVCLGENTCDDMKRVPKGSRKVTITPYHRMYTSYYEYRWE